METRDSMEMTAKTVEEAVELALRELGANREEVEVNVISRGRAGILGIGSELARVRVSRFSSEGSGVAIAMGVVNRLLSLIGSDALATIRSSGNGPEDPPVIDIQGEDSGLLIGRRGETLQSLQFVVNLLLAKLLDTWVRVEVDVEQYRARRNQSLRALAMRMAEQVTATGRTVTLEPMPPAERRIVHIALADHPDVLTQSGGVRDERKISISLKRGT